MKISRCKCIGFIIGMLLTVSVGAQTPYMKQISLFKGKESYSVNVVYQDMKGWIWFGTDRGLFRFDGVNLVQYTVNDSLSSNHITALGAESSGTLWIGHKEGDITMYTGKEFHIFRPEEGLGNVEITDFIRDKNGNTWYSTLGEGIFKYDGRHIGNLNTEDGLSDDYVYDIELDSEGRMWLATEGGISMYAEDMFEVISMKDGLPDNLIRVVKAGPSGNIFAGSDIKGIAVYNPADKSISEITGWEFGAVTGMAVNLRNELWISTDRHGVIKLNYNPETSEYNYQQLVTGQVEIPKRLNTIVKDRENNIWIAGRNGIVQSLPPVFEFLNEDSGTPFTSVFSFTIDNWGNCWACTERGLYRGTHDTYGMLTWYSVSDETGLEKTNFASIYTADDGSIWAGTYGEGVYRFYPGKDNVEHYTTSDGLLDESIIYISGDENRIWFSTLGGGVSWYDMMEAKIRTVKDPVLNSSYVYAAIEDENNKTWIAGSFSAPAFIHNGLFSLLDIDTSWQFTQLYGIAIDTHHNVLFNANENGLLLVSRDSVSVLGKEQGIDFEEINSIQFDKFNNLLIISNEGIQFRNPASGNFILFGDNMGLAYLSPVENSVYTDADSCIWIGTRNGIVKYDPDYLSELSLTPQIFLSTIELYDIPVDTARRKFKHNENNFTFGYTGIWFTNPEGISYRYMLEGYDIDWIYSKSLEPSTYSKLQPGRYSFRAEVSLNNSVWIESEEATFPFRIMPPFWMRWWFILISVIAIISGILLYIRMRLSNLKKAKEELEREVMRRTEKIRSQNELLEQQKEEIAAQRDNAEQQRDQIQQQSEEIQASIRYAQRIQAAALPPINYLNDLFGEYFILNRPRDIVSGDFYWASKRDDKVFFAVGDCTGHGVPGAFMSMLGLSALNDIVKSLDTCKASEVLDMLSSKIRESLHQEAEDGPTAQDGMDISLCIYDPKTSMLQFAAAHNSLYLVSDGNLDRIRADNLGIGSSFGVNKYFTNHEIKLKKGDIIYMSSDGFPDQFGGPEGKKYKSKHFRDFLLKIHYEEMTVQKQLLERELENWKGSQFQVDDIMILGVKKSI